MPLTTEEKKQRSRKRLAEKAAEEAKFPRVHYKAGDSLQICMKAGDGPWHGIDIRTNDLKKFQPDHMGGNQGWVRAYIPMNNIQDVAALIAGLTARLNYMIEEANKDIHRIQKVVKIQKGEQSVI